MEVAAAAMLIGAGVSAYSAYQTGRAQETIGQKNQAVANADADATEDLARQSADTKRKEISRLLASNRTIIAKQGFKSEGSDVVQSDIASEGDKDIMAILAQGMQQASRTRATGEIYAEQGRLAGQQGTYGAISTLLTGGAQSYSMYKYPRAS